MQIFFSSVYGHPKFSLDKSITYLIFLFARLVFLIFGVLGGGEGDRQASLRK